jgi:hypothetical protein
VKKGLYVGSRVMDYLTKLADMELASLPKPSDASLHDRMFGLLIKEDPALSTDVAEWRSKAGALRIPFGEALEDEMEALEALSELRKNGQGDPDEGEGEETDGTVEERDRDFDRGVGR